MPALRPLRGDSLRLRVLRLVLVVLLLAVTALAATAPPGKTTEIPLYAGGTVLAPPIEAPEVPEYAAGAAKAGFESVHFTIIPDFVDAAYIDRLQRGIEKYFSAFQKEYWDFIRPVHREAHLTLYVFSDQAAFDRMSAADVAAPPGQLGFSNKSADRIAFVRQDEYYKDIAIVVHEMTHVFNRFSLDKTPVWLDEGMAQYYSNLAAEASGAPDIKAGIFRDDLVTLDRALKDGRFARVRELLRMEDDEFYGESSKVNYAESWALVYYLRKALSPDGEERLANCYDLMATGREPYDAFTAVYGYDFDSLERDWLSYLDRLYAANPPAPAPLAPAADKKAVILPRPR